MAKIQFTIITPERVVYDQLVDHVSLSTESGVITILPGHIPVVTVLTSSELVAQDGAEEIVMAVFGGFARVADGVVTVLADSGERSDEIDEAQAEAARLEAQKALEEFKNKDDVAYGHLVAQLEKELARLKVVRRKRR